MNWKLRKIKKKMLLITFFSALFLSSCANGGDKNDKENMAIKCTKYVSSGEKLPKYIKNPITFVFKNENFEFSKSIPLSETVKNMGIKSFSYAGVDTQTFGFNFWGDLEIRLENDERIEVSPLEGKILPSSLVQRVRDLKYYIFKASIKNDEYKGKWTLLEDSGGNNNISITGALKCNLLKKS